MKELSTGEIYQFIIMAFLIVAFFVSLYLEADFTKEILIAIISLAVGIGGSNVGIKKEK